MGLVPSYYVHAPIGILVYNYNKFVANRKLVRTYHLVDEIPVGKLIIVREK